MSDGDWHVLDGEGNEQGPYSFQDLQEYYTTGNIDHETLIWTEGLEEWVPAGRVEGLLPDQPQATELAPAPAPPAPGFSLSPQIPGLASAGFAPAGKRLAPAWLVNLNLVTCLCGLILFFLPWIEIRCSKLDPDLMKNAPVKVEQNMLVLTQSGIQSVIGKASEAQLPELEPSKKDGAEKPESNFMEEMGADKEAANIGSASLILLALIAIGLALILGIIGFSNRGRGFLLTSQILCLCAAICIGVQMKVGFPIFPSVESAASSGQEGAALSAAFRQEFFQMNYTGWVKLELGLLGSSLIFMVIGLASGGTPPVTQRPGGMTPQRPGGFTLH